MVWTRMWREKINRNYTSISYVSGYDRAGNMSEKHWWCSSPISTSTWDPKKTLLHPKRSREIQKRIWGTNLDRATNERVTKFARRVKQKVKPQAQDTHWSEAVERKRTTRKIPQRIRKTDVNDYTTNQWLRSTGLKAETGGMIIAIQDQSLPTKSYFERLGLWRTARVHCAGYATTTKKQ